MQARSNAAAVAVAPSATVERLLERVRPALVLIEQEYRRHGRSVTELGVEALAGRMAAVVPAPSPVNRLIGPFYRTDQLTTLLGITRQAVMDRLRQRSLLGMRTSEGTWVYPTFQIEGRRVVTHLPPVLRSFARTDDGWAIGAWLSSPHAALHGDRPIDRIRSGADVEHVARLASAASRRWAG